MLHERIYELTGDRSGNMNQNNSNPKSPPPQLVKKRSKLGFTSEKKIADDEFMAAAIGDTEWLRQSLRNNRGAINFDKNGLAPIHLASIHGRLDCLKLLVDKLKLDVNMASLTGWRPVHLAISNQTGRRSFSCLSYLLAKGADPSITNDDGITPMHQAASEGHVQCMKALIEAGAKIDGEDCRSHKPLDLAKLWGHKKCARILAAEMWHRDKDFIAKEMRQLQKVKMQQVLREIEEDEEHRADQQFYGDIAFNQWLGARDLPPKLTGPPSMQNQPDPLQESAGKGALKGKLKGKEAGAKHESLSRANSMQRPTGKLKEIEEDAERKKSAEGGKAVSEKGEEEERPLRRRVSEVKFIEPVKEEPLVEEQPVSTEKKPIYINPIAWSKSPKISAPEYVTRLPDHYPRDEYTMLPKHPAARQRKLQDIPETGAASSAATSSRGFPRGEDAVRMPKLPADVIEKALSKDSTKNERPVVYRCKNIMDVQKRHHFDLDNDLIARPEIGLHMTNNLDSRIFQAALQPERIPTTPSTVISGLSTPSTGYGSSRSGRSVVRSVKVDVASVMNAMQRMNPRALTENYQEMTPVEIPKNPNPMIA